MAGDFSSADLPSNTPARDTLVLTCVVSKAPITESAVRRTRWVTEVWPPVAMPEEPNVSNVFRIEHSDEVHQQRGVARHPGEESRSAEKAFPEARGPTLSL